jgi:hypothetical protein
LHGWLQAELAAIVDTLPVHPVDPSRAAWTRWQDGLSIRWTLRETLPPLRVVLIFDNLVGHTSPELRCWCMDHGIMVLYTPLSGGRRGGQCTDYPSVPILVQSALVLIFRY